MSSKLEEWEDALPEGKDTLEISFRPSMNVEKQSVNWVINIRSRKLGNGEKYFAQTNFAPSEMDLLTAGVSEAQPLDMDVVASSIQTQIYKCIDKYIMQEIINNE